MPSLKCWRCIHTHHQQHELLILEYHTLLLHLLSIRVPQVSINFGSARNSQPDKRANFILSADPWLTFTRRASNPTRNLQITPPKDFPLNKVFTKVIPTGLIKQQTVQSSLTHKIKVILLLLRQD